MSNKLNTVNVIELKDFLDPASIVSLQAFEDTEEGNIEAEKVFKDTVKRIHPNLDDDDILFSVENGYCESSETNGGVYLVHSS